MKLFYANAGSFLNKNDELRISVNNIYDPDIICIVETHLNSNIDNNEISMENYNIFRQDRDFKIKQVTQDALFSTDGEGSSDISVSGGGGSLIYVKSYLRVELIDFKVADSLAISVQTNVGNVVIACVYRSPSLNDKQNRTMINEIGNLTKTYSESEVLLVGDFNLPDVCWVTGTLLGPMNTTDRFKCLQQDYLDKFTDLGYNWHITDEKTRVRLVAGVRQESTLDQVFSSNSAIVNNFSLLAPLGKSDHHSILVELNVDADGHKDFVKSNKTLWGKVSEADIVTFAEGIDWDYSSQDMLDEVLMWDELKTKLLAVSSKVPSVSIDSSKARKLPWENSSLKRHRREKDKFWSSFDDSPSSVNLSLALDRQRKYEKSEISAKVKYEKKITSCLKYASKPFFSYLRNKRKVRESVTSLKREDDSVTVGGGETAEELSSFFSSVFTEESFGPLEKHCFKKTDNYSEIGDFQASFDFLDVKKELLKVDPNKSMGPDGIHPKIIRALASDSSFVKASHELFTTCAENRRIPPEWKLANVVALHKKGSRDRSKNYRPISLTCIMGKVYEKLMRKHMIDHVENFLAPEQHGFLSGRSCTSNLLESMDVILDMVDEGLPVDMLFFDFSKAFDTVPHHRLLVKLENYGITGGTLEIIRDFLTDRWMRVGVGDHFSEFTRIISGVPQGSILGPLLFLLYINDLPEAIKSKIFMFADDLKMLANPLEKEIVENDLKYLEFWENTWLLKFNTAKCKVLHFDMNNNPCNEYILDGSILEVVESERDLGLVISKDLKWDEHVKSSLCKANQMIAWISRNVICKNLEVMKKIYTCLIRPHLEYCVQLWSPAAVHGNWGTIYELEKVQRKFTNLIDDIGTLPYGIRLARLDLTTLAERRIRGDLIETFKIVNKFVNYGQDIFVLGRSGRNIVSCGLKVSNFRKKFFSERVVQYWNLLPNYVKLSSSIDSFKANLCKHKSQQLEDEHYVSSVGNFWEVSERILQRIESSSSVAGRDAFCEYLNDNPWVAKRKGINIYKSSSSL